MRTVRIILTLQLPDGAAPPAVSVEGVKAGSGEGQPPATLSRPAALKALGDVGVKSPAALVDLFGAARCLAVVRYATTREPLPKNLPAFVNAALRRGYEIPEYCKEEPHE